MNRPEMLDRIRAHREPWDLVVVGGGATGVGIAVDGASRGYDLLLLEQSDFGKGTSSRSTKLIHGGVRYLRQGNVRLVLEALQERGLLLQNAPHLVRNLAFVVPNYFWWEKPFYRAGLKLYDLLAGRHGFGRSVALSTQEVLARIPALKREGLRGGVLYHDGQFDDTRLLISLARTAADHGACLMNYAAVIRLTKDANGVVNGLVFRDEESQELLTVGSRCVISATGVFCDQLRRLDNSAASPIVVPSQGAHVVLDRAFLPGDTAIMVPRTRDGRVMFAIPWQGHVLVGTTDTPIDHVHLEPRPQPGEIDFILETASGYLAKPPRRQDVLSTFAGIRPLVKASRAESTAKLSRDHAIQIAPSGLLTVVGGKWTTYRKMAEETVDQAIRIGRLQKRPCVTRDLPIHGHDRQADRFGELACYGADAPAMHQLLDKEPSLNRRLHPELPIQPVHVLWTVRYEMARTVEDVLARRTRTLFLNARASIEISPIVASLMASELGHDEAWQRDQVSEFAQLASNYLAG